MAEIAVNAILSVADMERKDVDFELIKVRIIFISFHANNTSSVLTECQLDQLVEVAHRECCWAAPQPCGHTELKPRNDRERFLLKIHQLVRRSRTARRSIHSDVLLFQYNTSSHYLLSLLMLQPF